MTLELEHLTLTFDDGASKIEALADVSLVAPPGRLTVVTGPSGSGKSTLLAVAGLLSTPDAGEVRVNGAPTSGLNQRERSRLRSDELAFIFQSSNLFDALTAIEQLEFVAHMRGSLDAAARERARSLLDVVGLADRAGHRPAMLSGGERQRVGIARALMSEPSVLLVDEPTAALDRTRSNEIMELIAATTRSSGIATLLVTHDLERLELADERFEMVDGRLSRPAAV